MIKKFLHIALTLILLVSTTGVALSKHYCGGEFSAMEVGHDQIQCCEQPEEMPDGCCQDEKLTFQVEESYQLSHFQFESALFIAAIFPNIDLSWLFETSSEVHTSYKPYHSPPIAQDIPVLLQSFLI